jgi:hypothetical protein
MNYMCHKGQVGECKKLHMCPSDTLICYNGWNLNNYHNGNYLI